MRKLGCISEQHCFYWVHARDMLLAISDRRRRNLAPMETATKMLLVLMLPHACLLHAHEVIADLLILNQGRGLLNACTCRVPCQVST